MSDRFLRIPEVSSITGLARSTIYLRLRTNQFPLPISLGGRMIAWVETDIRLWQKAQLKANAAIRRKEIQRRRKLESIPD